MTAVWQVGDTEEIAYPSLTGTAEFDVVVIGGGITGLTVAHQLVEAGKQVVVLEAGRVGKGNTGNSTGNLYSTVAKGLASIRKKWGDEVTADVVRSRAEAIDLIESLVSRFKIDCQFNRTPLYRVLTDDSPPLVKSLDAERDALLSAGLGVHEVENKLFGLNVKKGLKLENQAQFNPLLYTQGLAKAASASGATLHEQSPVREIDYDRGLVKTDAGEIQARHIVHATHTPKGIDLLQTGMVPAREYCVSAKLKNFAYPEGVLWVLDSFHSLRSYHYNGQDYVMAVGEKHKIGEDTLGEGHYENLRQYLRQHFDVQTFEHQWSAQQYSSADELPYIGKMHGVDNAYVATGFSSDGLTWGTLAGTIISDLIRGRQNPWSERYDASRFTPAKSMKGWLKENAKVTKDLVKDYLHPDRIKTLDEVKPGEARVVTLDGEKLAVYRETNGQLSVVSAVCPHMKCVVHWNGADTSWDCPCHGSRFDTEGAVIEGPAFHPLEKRLGSSQ